ALRKSGEVPVHRRRDAERGGEAGRQAAGGRDPAVGAGPGGGRVGRKAWQHVGTGGPGDQDADAGDAVGTAVEAERAAGAAVSCSTSWMPPSAVCSVTCIRPSAPDDRSPPPAACRTGTCVSTRAPAGSRLFLTRPATSARTSDAAA